MFHRFPEYWSSLKNLVEFIKTELDLFLLFSNLKTTILNVYLYLASYSMKYSYKQMVQFVEMFSSKLRYYRSNFYCHSSHNN